jgi:hypothetical protein
MMMYIFISTGPRPTHTGDNSMTKEQALEAISSRLKIEAGSGDDYDTGFIISVDGDMAIVAWDSGARTPTPLCDIEEA